MPVRRHADPNNVQYIWDGIKSAKHQHQSAEISNLAKFLQNETNCTFSQAELYINQTLKDGLIAKYEPKSVRLSHPSDYFRIPTDELTTPYDDGKDWYCIECHLAGDVTPCKTCHRVFHAECSRNVRHKQVVFQSVEKYQQLNASSSLNTSTNESGSSEKVNESTKMSNESNKELNRNDPASSNTKEMSKIVNENESGFVYDEHRCSICNIHMLENKCDLVREELNHLLWFILKRIRSWLPSNLTHTMAPDQKYAWTTEEDLNWRAAQLFYQHMDMNVMELRLQSQEYTKVTEFMADVITIQHNVAIFHGIESQEYGAAELMIRDTCHDVTELKTCADCYRHSNEKVNSKWFCLPCRRPHKLVWAKQKGYPYWPAKVIKETDATYDVRFFGGKYERSLLPKSKKNVLPIEEKPKSRELKKSAAFTKALEELKLHQQLLKNPNSLKEHVIKIIPKEPSKETKQIERLSKITTKKILIKSNILLRGNTGRPSEASPPVRMERDPNLDKKNTVKRKSAILNEHTGKSRRISVNPENQQSTATTNVQEIIPISDAEEDDFMTLDNYGMVKGNDGCYGQVSSSTEYFVSNDDGFHTQEISDVMHPLEQPYSDAVEKMRRQLEQAKDKKQLIGIAMDCMQQEIDKITNDHNEQGKKLYEAHQAQISETKKKQWCYNCEQDAIYHCCWNTAYCSPTCQQQHWQAEHKKVCRRKK